MSQCNIIHSNGEGGGYTSGTSLVLTPSNGNLLNYPGTLSSDATAIFFSIPLPHNFSNITSVTVSSLMINIRSSLGGYLGKTSWVTTGWDAASLATVTGYAVAPNILTIKLIKSDGWGQTNNTTVVVSVASLSVTFN